MATAPDTIAELGHMIGRVHAQIGRGLGPASCAQQQFNSLAAKIGNLSTIGVEDATELVSAIRCNALG